MFMMLKGWSLKYNFEQKNDICITKLQHIFLCDTVAENNFCVCLINEL